MVQVEAAPVRRIREALPPHRPLGTTGWRIWDEAVLRSTGFPVSGLARLAAPHCAAEVDAALRDGDGSRGRARAAFEAGQRECSAQLAAIAGDPLFREALAWQNRSALPYLTWLVTGDALAARNKKRRVREHMVTRYWQRYCAKAETIGFFGPSLWVAFDDATHRLRMHPGRGLVDRRRVFVEPWALVALGAALAEDEDVRWWLPPARMPHHVLDGRQVCRPGLPPVALTATEALVLVHCDGRTPAAGIAAALGEGDPGWDTAGCGDLGATLTALVARGVACWDTNLPLGPTTRGVLVERIEAIGDEAVKARARAPLAAIDRAVARVARAAGRPDELLAALAGLDDCFVRLTGRAPTRAAGQTYAGRTLCYEDTTRNLQVFLGAGLADDLAPALDVVLIAARWLTARVAAVYEDKFGHLFAAAAAGADDGDREVGLDRLWPGLCQALWGPGARVVDDVFDDFARRWRTVLGLDAEQDGRPVSHAAHELAGPVAQAFPGVDPGWSTARVHSPDLLLAAPSAAAVEAGDYLAVLGEVHVASATSCDHALTWSQDDPGRRLAATVAECGPRFLPMLRPSMSRDAGRTVLVEPAPGDRYIGVARVPGATAAEFTPMGRIRVRETPRGLVGRFPDGCEARLIELVAHLLSGVVANAFKQVALGAYTPRVTVGRVVLGRETWRVPMARLDGLCLTNEYDQYVAGRRLVAELGLPERCFVGVPAETKPVFVDFTSPAYVSSLSAMLRAAQRARPTRGADPDVIVSEMLPTPEQCWVEAAGERYLAELRIQISDPLPPATAR